MSADCPILAFLHDAIPPWEDHSVQLPTADAVMRRTHLAARRQPQCLQAAITALELEAAGGVAGSDARSRSAGRGGGAFTAAMGGALDMGALAAAPTAGVVPVDFSAVDEAFLPCRRTALERAGYFTAAAAAEATVGASSAAAGSTAFRSAFAPLIDARASLVAVGCDVARGGGAKLYHALPRSDILRFVTSTAATRRNFYAMVDPQLPIDLYVDLDGRLTDADLAVWSDASHPIAFGPLAGAAERDAAACSVAFQAIAAAAICGLEATLRHAYGDSLVVCSCVVADGCVPAARKLSYHLHLRLAIVEVAATPVPTGGSLDLTRVPEPRFRPAAFRDVRALHRFMVRYVCGPEAAVPPAPSSGADATTAAATTGSGNEQRWQKFVDPGVYSSWRLMRLPFCVKREPSGRTLLPLAVPVGRLPTSDLEAALLRLNGPLVAVVMADAAAKATYGDAVDLGDTGDEACGAALQLWTTRLEGEERPVSALSTPELRIVCAHFDAALIVRRVRDQLGADPSATSHYVYLGAVASGSTRPSLSRARDDDLASAGGSLPRPLPAVRAEMADGEIRIVPPPLPLRELPQAGGRVPAASGTVHYAALLDIFRRIAPAFGTLPSLQRAEYEETPYLRQYYAFQRGCRYCPRAGREHKGTYVQLYVTYGSIKVRCYSNDCALLPCYVARWEDLGGEDARPTRDVLFPDLGTEEVLRRYGSLPVLSNSLSDVRLVAIEPTEIDAAPAAAPAVASVGTMPEAPAAAAVADVEAPGAPAPADTTESTKAEVE